ncbi:unnamed protein product [Protopolystoma xenopodis]|uniref:Uncharacterized protein n=1 Tax=Protopolystoma xenopodis TaxID=117903 RepID=A0A448WAU5_9PLAT|nr:unnamed protein product [Protopolystoma xenopodis]
MARARYIQTSSHSSSRPYHYSSSTHSSRSDLIVSLSTSACQSTDLHRESGQKRKELLSPPLPPPTGTGSPSGRSSTSDSNRDLLAVVRPELMSRYLLPRGLQEHQAVGVGKRSEDRVRTALLRLSGSLEVTAATHRLRRQHSAELTTYDASNAITAELTCSDGVFRSPHTGPSRDGDLSTGPGSGSDAGAGLAPISELTMCPRSAIGQVKTDEQDKKVYNAQGTNRISNRRAELDSFSPQQSVEHHEQVNNHDRTTCLWDTLSPRVIDTFSKVKVDESAGSFTGPVSYPSVVTGLRSLLPLTTNKLATPVSSADASLATKSAEFENSNEDASPIQAYSNAAIGYTCSNRDCQLKNISPIFDSGNISDLTSGLLQNKPFVLVATNPVSSTKLLSSSSNQISKSTQQLETDSMSALYPLTCLEANPIYTSGEFTCTDSGLNRSPSPVTKMSRIESRLDLVTSASEQTNTIYSTAQSIQLTTGHTDALAASFSAKEVTASRRPIFMLADSSDQNLYKLSSLSSKLTPVMLSTPTFHGRNANLENLSLDSLTHVCTASYGKESNDPNHETTKRRESKEAIHIELGHLNDRIHNMEHQLAGVMQCLTCLVYEIKQLKPCSQDISPATKTYSEYQQTDVCDLNDKAENVFNSDTPDFQAT